jgi:YopT-type cysteine protease-like protein
MASLADMIGASRAGPVQRSVQGYGGQCTFPFTQCRPPISSFISRDESTAIGVCESISAHWIKYHAEGSSLWNWLIVNGEISMTKLLYGVMQLQSQGILSDDQDATTEAWLRQEGIVPVKRNTKGLESERTRIGFRQFQGAFLRGVQRGQTRMHNAKTVARAILDDPTGGAGLYKKLSLEGKFGAHTMALWVAQDVAFFDANFGEFWFESRAGFFNWFTKKFWSSSLYNIGLSGNYEVYPYAKRV